MVTPLSDESRGSRVWDVLLAWVVIALGANVILCMNILPSLVPPGSGREELVVWTVMTGALLVYGVLARAQWVSHLAFPLSLLLPFAANLDSFNAQFSDAQTFGYCAAGLLAYWVSASLRLSGRPAVASKVPPSSATKRSMLKVTRSPRQTRLHSAAVATLVIMSALVFWTVNFSADFRAALDLNFQDRQPRVTMMLNLTLSGVFALCFLPLCFELFQESRRNHPRAKRRLAPRRYSAGALTLRLLPWALLTVSWIALKEWLA